MIPSRCCRGWERAIAAALLDGHLEDGAASSVCDLHLHPEDTSGLGSEFAIDPQSLVENGVQIGELNAILILD